MTRPHPDLDAIAARVKEMNWFTHETDIINITRTDYEALVTEVKELREKLAGQGG